FAQDTGIELHWRNLRLFRVGPVPEELALSYVAHNILKLPRSF
ncbi:acyl-CoA dehydrogenase, partial [Candidatus Marsarchaeota G2 archaeon BE_D]